MEQLRKLSFDESHYRGDEINTVTLNNYSEAGSFGSSLLYIAYEEDTMQLKIDLEFESRIPPLTEDEFQQLEENILADGVIISPIIVWNNLIIDGHNRFRIVEKHPHIDFTTCERNFNNRHEALAWICKNQLGRRNLTFQQKKYLIGKRYESEKASYGGNRNLSHDENGRFTTGSQVGNLGSGQKTCEKIANEYGISRNSVIRAETFSKAVDIADEIDPGIRSEILAGKIKPTQTDVEALTKAEPEERPSLVEDLRKPPEERRRVLPERHLLTLEQIAAELPSEDFRGTPESMLYELEDALDTFIFRWSVCLSHNKDYFLAKKHNAKVNKLAKDGLTYLNQILKGEIPL